MSGKINSIDQLRLSLNILSREDVLKIHTATLDVIESIGVRFPSQKALNILEAHGATIDRDTMIAKIPGRIVEDALKTAPPIYTLAARDPHQDLLMDGQHVFLGTDGCCIEVIDAFTGERRRTTKKDSEDCARVAVSGGRWWLHRINRRNRARCTNSKRRGATPRNTCKPRASSLSQRCAPRSRWPRPSWVAKTNCASGLSSRSCNVPRVRLVMTVVHSTPAYSLLRPVCRSGI